MQIFTLTSEIRGFIFRGICLLVLLCGGLAVHAQTAHFNTDSATRARRDIADATRARQQHSLDSARTARQRTTDSLKAARETAGAALAAIRKHRESKFYKDSIIRARTQRMNAMHNTQKARTDSLKAIRQHSTDSLVASRKKITDVLRATQKKRTDSLNAIRKYKQSRRYADSVFIVRKDHIDSLKQAREAASKAIAASRKKSIDSLKAIRKSFMDSTTAVRKIHTDSLKAVRKIKSDALLAAKAKREKDAKANEKKKQSILDTKLAIKMNKKRSVYTNESMLKKRWAQPRRTIQNTFTHYNYYFNANRKMDEALANMQRITQDNFSLLLPLFPFDPNKDSARLAPDMDSIIHKCSLGIQIHDPRTKWADDLYLILGQAFYYKGDYTNAIASFRYIISIREREKAAEAKKHALTSNGTRKPREDVSVVDPGHKGVSKIITREPANNDALLWLTRTYIQTGNESAAESILDIVSSNAQFPADMKGQLALEKAFLDLHQYNTRDATSQLALVAADKTQPAWMRRRAAFLDGQLLQNLGNYTASAEKFAYVSELSPKIDMDFYARRNRAYSLMLAGGPQDAAIASLKSMVNDGKYTPYYEQIYYLLGRLAANSGNVKDAQNYLEKSLASTKTTKKQKASSFALLGNIYYNAGNYEQAKKSYDSASYLAAFAPDDSAVTIALRRSSVLDKISVPSRIIHDEDSLLTLSGMTSREQHAVARRYIRSLEQARIDSAFRAENAGINAAAQTETNPGDNAITWYFSNPGLMQQGHTEFLRKWGQRPLADNWRRSTASSVAGGNNQNANNAGADNNQSSKVNGVELDDRGLPTEDGLLAFVPSEKAQQDEARRMIQRAYVDLGSAYVRQLEDYPRAGAALDSLDRHYATHPYRAEELYVRYLIALRRNRLPEAQQYSNQLREQFPASTWADLVKPAEDGANTAAAGVSAASYYDETYNMMQQRQYAEVLTRARYARRQYADDIYGNRFRIVEAIAQTGLGNYRAADSMLGEFIRLHPSDSLLGWAESVRRYAGEQNKLRIADSAKAAKELAQNVSASATAANTTSKTAAADTSKTAVNPAPGAGSRNADSILRKVPAAFTWHPKEEHYFVFACRVSDTKAMGVRAALGDFNNMAFKGAPLKNSVEGLSAGPGLIIVRGLKSAAEAKSYLAAFKQTTIAREYSQTEYQTFVISASNYLKLQADGDTKPYLEFYRSRY